jgi:hypothetical protein
MYLIVDVNCKKKKKVVADLVTVRAAYCRQLLFSPVTLQLEPVTLGVNFHRCSIRAPHCTSLTHLPSPILWEKGRGMID